jgi:hypothetical protein
VARRGKLAGSNAPRSDLPGTSPISDAPLEMLALRQMGGWERRGPVCREEGLPGIMTGLYCNVFGCAKYKSQNHLSSIAT